MRDMFGKMAEMKYGTISFATNQRSLSKVRIVVIHMKTIPSMQQR